MLKPSSRKAIWTERLSVWSLAMALAFITFLIFLPLLLLGCAANRVAFVEQHWYPTGTPKSVVEIHQLQLTTAGSKMQEGSNDLYRLDDTSVQIGNQSRGMEAAGDPVAVIKAAVPILAALEPLFAAQGAAQAVSGQSKPTIVDILKALQGLK